MLHGLRQFCLIVQRQIVAIVVSRSDDVAELRLPDAVATPDRTNVQGISDTICLYEALVEPSVRFGSEGAYFPRGVLASGDYLGQGLACRIAAVMSIRMENISTLLSWLNSGLLPHDA